MCIFVHFKLGESYLVWGVVDLEDFLVSLSDLLVVLSKFELSNLEISIRLVHFIEASL